MRRLACTSACKSTDRHATSSVLLHLLVHSDLSEMSPPQAFECLIFSPHSTTDFSSPFLCLHSAWYIRYTSGMSNKTLKKLLDERTRLLAELGTLPHMLHGSWVARFSLCSRPGCQCHSGHRHGPRHYLVIREGGRQRQKYVPNSQVAAAQAGLAEYGRVREIVDRITHINLTLMKEGAYED